MNGEIDIPNFQTIEDVKITMRAELDRRIIPFPELMRLEVGSILQLSRPTGENVDLYAGNVLIGNGEIQVTDSTIGVRVADLLNNAAPDGEDVGAR